MKPNPMRVFLMTMLFMFAAGLLIPILGCGVAKDSRLQMKIKEKLSEDRNVQHEKLTINVKDGIVTISGELYTREEIDRVIEIVEAIDGVLLVKNLMNLPSDYNTRNPTFLDPFN